MIFLAIFLSFVTMALASGFAFIAVQAFIPRHIVGVIPWCAWYAITGTLGVSTFGCALLAHSAWETALLAGLR